MLTDHIPKRYGWFSPNISYPLNKSSPEITQTECSAAVPCLYNLNVSITEHDNVADEHPDVVAALVSRMIEVAEEYHPPQMNPPVDLDGYCAAVKASDHSVDSPSPPLVHFVFLINSRRH